MLENEGTQEKETRKENVLKVSDIDSKFKYEISKLPGAENVLLCFQCGTCTADCHIARFSDFYRPREPHRSQKPNKSNWRGMLELSGRN